MYKEHKNLEIKLKDLQQKKEIKNYILNSSLTKSESLSFNNPILGGAYNPLHNDNNFGGFLTVEWQDGKISKTTVEPSCIKNFSTKMKTLKSLRYEDEAEKNFLEQPENIHFTEQSDSIIQNNEYSTNKVLVKRAQKYQNFVDKLGEKARECEISIGTTSTYVSNSKNLNLEETRTIAYVSMNLAGKTTFGFGCRKIENLKKDKKFLKRLGELYNATQNKVKYKNQKDVLLNPRTFIELLDTFLISNIVAGSIYNKDSAFNMKSFEKNQIVGNKDFNIITEPKRSMSIGASNFSEIGWTYPKKETFIKDGKLIKPISNHRYANLLNIDPTPPISSYKLIDLGDIESPQSIEQSVEKIENGLYIQVLLGVHTVNKSTGDFSLVAPNAVIIGNGEMIGITEVLVRGNMFEILRDIEVIYRDTLTEKPYAILPGVEITPT
jgi:PmbA protein